MADIFGNGGSILQDGIKWVYLNQDTAMYFRNPGENYTITKYCYLPGNSGTESSYPYSYFMQGDYLAVKDAGSDPEMASYYEIDMNVTLNYNSHLPVALFGDYNLGYALNNEGNTNEAPVYIVGGIQVTEGTHKVLMWMPPAKYSTVYILKENCTQVSPDGSSDDNIADSDRETSIPPSAGSEVAEQNASKPSPSKQTQTQTAPQTVVKPQIIPNGLSDATYQDSIWNKDVTTKGANHYKPYFFRDLQGLIDGKLDITIDYGPGSRTQNVIKSVYLRSVGTEFDASGNPVYEVYDLVARDVEIPVDWTAPIEVEPTKPGKKPTNPVPAVSNKWSWDTKGKTIQEVGKMLSIWRGNGSTFTGQAQMSPYGDISGYCCRKYMVQWDESLHRFSPSSIYNDAETTTTNYAKDAFPEWNDAANKKLAADIDAVVSVTGKQWSYWEQNKDKHFTQYVDCGTKSVVIDGKKMNVKLTWRQVITLGIPPTVGGVWVAGVASQYNWHMEEV